MNSPAHIFFPLFRFHPRNALWVFSRLCRFLLQCVLKSPNFAVSHLSVCPFLKKRRAHHSDGPCAFSADRAHPARSCILPRLSREGEACGEFHALSAGCGFHGHFNFGKLPAYPKTCFSYNLRRGRGEHVLCGGSPEVCLCLQQRQCRKH